MAIGHHAAALRRCGVSQVTTAAWTLAEDVAAYRELGVGAIGVWLHKLERPTMDSFWFPETELSPKVVEDARARIATAGLRVSHVLLAGPLTQPDDEARRGRIEHALHALSVAEALDAACLVVIPGRLYGQSYAQAEEFAVSALSEILDRSSSLAPPVALEPVTDVDFAHTIDLALDLVERVGSRRIGVYLDTYHAWQLGTDPEPSIERCAGKILGVHVADLRRLSDGTIRELPGDGELRLVETLKAIERTGYRGSYDVELLGYRIDAPPEDVLARSVHEMEALLVEVID